MIKLIASDIDGTLVKDGTLQINPRLLTVIGQLLDRGIIFTACSGRQFISEKKLFAPIKDRIFYISDGGAVIRSSTELLQVNTLDVSIYQGMLDTMQYLPNCDCFLATPDFCLATDAHSAMFRWLKDSYGFDMRQVEDLSKVKREDIIKFTVYHKDSCEEMCKPLFIPTWEEHAKIVCAGKEWVDCSAKNVNKGNSIAWLQNYLSISPEETCVFGDNLNDIEMLQNAKYSFAVSNARKEVLDAAKFRAKPYYEDGVLEVLEQILDGTIP